LVCLVRTGRAIESYRFEVATKNAAASSSLASETAARACFHVIEALRDATEKAEVVKRHDG